jgi:hypothetical protein
MGHATEGQCEHRASGGKNKRIQQLFHEMISPEQCSFRREMLPLDASSTRNFKLDGASHNTRQFANVKFLINSWPVPFTHASATQVPARC